MRKFIGLTLESRASEATRRIETIFVETPCEYAPGGSGAGGLANATMVGSPALDTPIPPTDTPIEVATASSSETARIETAPVMLTVPAPVAVTVGEAVAVADAPVAPRREARHEGRARRDARWHRRVGLREVRALTEDAVEVRRLDDRVPAEPQAVGAPLVDVDEEDIRRF